MRCLSREQRKWLSSLTNAERDHFLGFYTDKDGNVRQLTRKKGDEFTVAGKTFIIGATTTMSGGAGEPPKPELKWWQKIF